MSDTMTICSRCDKSMNADAFALALAKEIPESVPGKLRLCPRCVESFQHWYQKRAKSTGKPAPHRRSESSSGLPTEFRSDRSKRERQKQMHRVVVVASLTICVFLLAFYGTWMILKTVTHVE